MQNCYDITGQEMISALTGRATMMDLTTRDVTLDAREVAFLVAALQNAKDGVEASILHKLQAAPVRTHTTKPRWAVALARLVGR